MRFQHGVDDRPTRLPISATESDASSCSTVKILRSMASIEIFFQLRAFVTLYIEKYFRSRGKSLSRKSACPGPFCAPMSGGGIAESGCRRARIRAFALHSARLALSPGIQRI